MGLSASQVRYLSLTSRKSEVEYNVQQLTYQQTLLTRKTQDIATEYNDKMNNKKYVYNTYNDKGNEVQKTLTYELITSAGEDGGLNMRIVDKTGNVVVPSLPQDTEYMKIKDKETGEYTKVTDKLAFIAAYLPDISEEELEKIKDYSFTSLANYWENTASAEDKEKYSIKILTQVPSNMKSTDERYLIDANANDASYLYDKLSKGDWTIQMVQVATDNTKSWYDINSFEELSISEVMDTSDDAAAQAKYDSALASITTQQKELDYQLKQLDTEHQALVKELDSVLEVINNNIENSYNKFSS